MTNFPLEKLTVFFKGFAKHLSSEPRCVHKKSREIQVFDDRRVVLTPFFAYGYSNQEMEDRVTETLRDWGVEIS